jgi:WhiB family transcriptional regulator, redox-sensing transcriptional regulator
MLIHTLLMTITDWIDQASCSTCTGKANWFADEGSIELISAVRICKTQCPVKDECLAHALRNEERHGVWGGTTPRQRLLLTRTGGQHQSVVLTPRRH